MQCRVTAFFINETLQLPNKRISLSSINDTNQRYQNRDIRTGTYGEMMSERQSSKAHVKSLVKKLLDAPNGSLDTIEVTYDPEDNQKYIIVDGFHRFAAYKEVNKKTNGERFRQIRVKVLDEVSVEKALSINAENRTKPLTASQQTEVQWQKFLVLMQNQPSISTKETANAIGVTPNTVTNWRRDRRAFIEAGFFSKSSDVAKYEVTGFPILKQARDELRKSRFEDPEPESNGQLCEADKKLLQVILKSVNKAKEPDKLKRVADLFWGENYNHVDYDIDPDTEIDAQF